jgi:flagellar biosynthesis/type III secretory pathway M-ring protein FliF/YscJ
VAVTVAGFPAVARADVISPAVPLAIGGTILLLIGLVFTLVVALIAWFVLKGIARRRSERTAAAAAAQPEHAEPGDMQVGSADSAPPSDDIVE